MSHEVLERSADGTITTVVGIAIAGEIGLAGPITADGAGNLWFSAGAGLREISSDGTVTTVAGYGSCCYSGDGGPANKAQLLHSNSVAADSSGNVYIADTGNHRIREVMPNGIIKTAAGSGAWSIDCDSVSAGSGPATAGQLCSPSQVAVDGAGNLFIADRNRIRQVSPDGAITSIAGDGTVGISPDGGPATQAQLAYPNSIAADSASNLYFAEWSRIRKILLGGTITTVAGTSARFTGNGCFPPGGPGCGKPPPTGDGQSAISVQLLGPTSVTADTAGNFYFIDGPRIRKVTPDGIISTAAGNGGQAGYHAPTGDGLPATDAPLWSPNGVTVDSAGNLYISEPVRIRKVTTDGIIQTIAGNGEPGYSGDGGPATKAQLWNPTGLSVDAVGNVYFADSLNNVIRVLRAVP